MKVKKLKINEIKETDEELDVFRLKSKQSAEVPPKYPIITEEKNGKYILLYGFEQVSKRDKNQIAISYVVNNITKKEKIKLLVEYHRQKRKLYPVEIAEIIQVAKENDIEKGIIANEIADAMGINRGYKIVEDYNSINGMPDYLSEFLIEKDASFKIWKKVRRRVDKIYKVLINELNPSLGDFLIISRNLEEIARGENKSVNKIAKDLKIYDYIEEDGNPTTNIKEKLNKARYPELTRNLERIDNELSKIGTPKNININYDRTLETRNIDLMARITNREDMKEVKKFVKSEGFKKIKKLLKEIQKI